MSLEVLRQQLWALQSPQKAEQQRRFFKMGPGEYAEHDRFLGIYVVDIKRLAREFCHLSLAEIEFLLTSEFNEERLCALFILRHQFERSESKEQKEIVDFYLAHLERVDNWNLVDASAPFILGGFIVQHPSDILDELSLSPQMWRRRVAIVGTLAFIRKNQFDPTLRIAERLLNDPEDLIHKATGWMLREVGKRDENALLGFLDRFSSRMNRTALRYAIERFDHEARKGYLLRSRENDKRKP